MKYGRSLTELAQEIERQNNAKSDYIASTPQLEMTHTGSELAIQGIGEYMINDIAHGQIGTSLDIPKKYYEKMMNDAPELLQHNVNHWFHSTTPKKKMVRTLDGNIRAMLSGKYRPMDNYELATAILPILSEHRLEIKSCELTNKKMYLKATFPQLQREVQPGDVVESGLMVSNSEVGFGSLMIQPLVNRLVCSNGMVINDARLNKRHVGKEFAPNSIGAYEILADDTREASDKALWLTVRDIVKSTLSENTFDKYVRKFVESTEIKVDGNVHEAVKRVGKNMRLTDHETDGVLRHLIEGHDLSSWGMANAVTRAAQDVESYDRSTELEVIGGKVIELGSRAWVA